MTTVVNLRQSEYDVYIGRPSKWGNPFIIGQDGTREQVVKLYREYILSTPSLLADLDELVGKRLGCFCEPLLCHGHVLAELANETFQN